MSSETDYDYWTQVCVTSTPSAPVLDIEIIADIEPLDGQFGVHPRKYVPSALHDAVFAQPEAVPSTDGHAAPSRAPLHTFAIIDAAKVPNLVEMLDLSDLEHRCLFKGDAFDELNAVAPWIVRLEEENGFTCNLFTKTDAQWHLWGKDPGIFIRSRSSLEEMWHHFRRFTRVRNESGTWLYFRFWESGSLPELLRSWGDTPDKLAAFLALSKPDPVLSVICTDHRNRSATVFALETQFTRETANAPFFLDARDRQTLSAWREMRFDRTLLAGLRDTYPNFASVSPEAATGWLRSVIAAAEGAGIKLETAIVDFVHAACLLRGDPCTHGETIQIIRDRTLHQKDRARLARQAAERVSKIRE